MFFNLTPIFENFTRYAAISLLFSLLATLLVIDLVDYFKKRATKKGKQLRNKYFININSPLQLFFLFKIDKIEFLNVDLSPLLRIDKKATTER